MTDRIDNYPGLHEGISGVDLAMALSEHAKRFGAEVLSADVLSLSLAGQTKLVQTKKAELEAKAVILCMGARPRKLNIPGEESFSGAGISYCATCDGAFFRNRNVAVIGGGDTAVHDALYLAQLGCSVHVIHRRGELRASRSSRTRLEENSLVTIHWNTVPLEFTGNTALESMAIENVETHERDMLDICAAFIAIGAIPQSELVASQLALTANGEIVTDERMRTSVPGIFAAGDVRNTPFRQILTAAADGAIAANEAMAYINGI